MFASRERPVRSPSQKSGTPSQKSGPPRTDSEASTSKAVSFTNGVNSAAHSESAKITILVKPTDEASAKYQKELGSLVDAQGSSGDSLESVLDFVAADRLRRMPHKGSRWDKVLRMAVHFATHVSMYQEAVGPMILKSPEAARLIWGSCRILLQMGPGSAEVLEQIFGVLFKMSLELSVFLRNRKLFAANEAIQDELARAYADILVFVIDATVRYAKATRATSVKEFDNLYRRRVDSFFHHRDQISNVMWTHELQQSMDSLSVTIQTIREWLAPKDQILRRFLSNSRSSRAEFTCEWFDAHLMSFSRGREDLFLVTANSGCGKSALSGWIVERLQRGLGRRSFETFSVSIDADVKGETKPLNIVKRLLIQVLEQSIGNVSLYKQLCAVFEMAARNETTAVDVEEGLWKAFDSALSADRDIMIVIDGLDEIAGGEMAGKKILGKMHDISGQKKSVKSIVLTQSPSKPFSSPARHLSIEPKLIHNDMHGFVYQTMNSYHHFHDRKEDEKQLVTQRITHAANGNFVFAELTMERLKKEKTHNGFTQALDHAPKSLSEAIDGLISGMDLSKSDNNLILSWLLVTERPLTLSELQCLLEMGATKENHIGKVHGLEHDIREKYGSLLSVKDGFVFFRHGSIRQFLLDHLKSYTSLLQSQDAQRDLVTRCAAYAKTNLSGPSETALDPLEPHAVRELFHKHVLLEYTVRYWTAHFFASPMYDIHGAHKFTPEFKQNFPDSVTFALMEWSCWESQSFPSEAMSMHLLALQVRRAVLKEHVSVLQCLITIASTYEQLSDFSEARRFYYQASKLAQITLGRYSTFARILATNFLRCTGSMPVKGRNEDSNHKEDMLSFIITAHKHSQYHSDKDAIEYRKLLAQLYTDMGEAKLAAKTHRDVYQACVDHYGEAHPETADVSRKWTSVLNREPQGEDMEQHTVSVYQIAQRTMEVTDQRRIDATFRLVEMYEAQKHGDRAEEIIIGLWRKLALICYEKPQQVEYHQRKIEVALAYVRFLKRHSRRDEAEHVLRGLWSEYEHEEIRSEDLTLRLKTVAEELRELQIFAVALSIYASIWNFYKRIGKQNSVEAASVAICLADITQTTQGSLTEEDILREVFDFTISRASTSKMDLSTIKTCLILSAYYEKRERWSDAIRVCHEVLKHLWQSLVKGQGAPTLPKEFVAETIELGTRQASCHLQIRESEKAEKIYIYISAATKTSHRIEDDMVLQAAQELIGFYESVDMPEKAIKAGRELWELYSAKLGKTHSLTLEILYILGNLCVKYKNKEAERYYLEIYTNLDKGSDTCHQDAIDAAFALIRLYKSENRWVDAQKVYGCIWQTIIKRGKEYHLEANFVDNAYHNYLFVLEKRVNVEYRVLLQVSIEYRNTCIALFGPHSEIALKATMQLAAIYERSDEKRSEAITMYETAFKETESKSSTSSTALSILAAAKARLAQLYLTSSSSNPQNSSKAVTLLTEQFDHTKSQHGCSHEATLTQLRELVNLYKKQNTQQLNAAAVRMLQASSIEVITTEKDYKKLFDAATSLASNYVSLSYTQEAYKLLYEMRRQIVFKDFGSSESHGFKLDHTGDRRSYVFLVAFEETLKGSKVVSFSTIMADLLTETILYEVYTQSVKQNSSFETILLRGARLRSFQKSKHYDDQATKLEDELLAMFQKDMGSAIKTNKNILRRFFIILLEELGKDQPDIHIVNAAVNTGCNNVYHLIEQSKFQEAFDLATCVWQFTKAHQGFYNRPNINAGFKLSLALAGRGTKRSLDQKLRDQMLELSKNVLKEVLEASRHVKVNYTDMPINEINQLVGLLGEQKNFSDLERFLAYLWDSRDSQKSWSSSTVIWIGRRLVEVRFSHGHQDAAIDLLEDIIYNMRRVWGYLDKTTLEMCTLLSEFYTAAGRHKDAMGVHEGVLRNLISDEIDEPMPNDAAKISIAHLEFLKRCYQRNGGWDKDAGDYKSLYMQLQEEFKEDKSWTSMQGIDKWPKQGADGLGVFNAPSSWGFLGQDGTEKHENLLRRLGRGGYDGSKNGAH